MSVATDLQTVVSRMGVAIAGGDTYGRVELDRLNRELATITEDARAAERAAAAEKIAVDQLLDGFDKKVLDFAALVRRTRDRRDAQHPAGIARQVAA